MKANDDVRVRMLTRKIARTPDAELDALLDSVPKDVLVSVLELAQKRLRKQIRDLQADGWMMS